MTNAILKNMSTALAEPSQMVDPSESDSFEETHRHYSFITVLAIMSLFILITVSIVALILGFCRKKNSVFALNGNNQDKKSDGGGDTASHFELDSLDVDLEDVETKVCRDDPRSACYYHLSDDDDDDDEWDNGYLQIEDGRENSEKSSDHQSRHSGGHRHKKRAKKQRKSKLRDNKYYYNLYNEGEDESDRWEKSDKDDNHSGDESTPLTLPRRSTTLPQLHSVLTSCIRGESLSPQTQFVYQKSSFPLPTLPKATLEKSLDINDSPRTQQTVMTDSVSSPTSNRCELVTTSTCYPSNLINKTENNHSCETSNSYQQHHSPSATTTHEDIHPLKNNDSDSPALLHPETTHLHRTTSSGTQALILDRLRQGQPVYIPSKGKGPLFKSHSLHDISRPLAKKTQKSRTRPSPKHAHRGQKSAQASSAHRQVTFKVGTLDGDADIRVHRHT